MNVLVLVKAVQMDNAKIVLAKIVLAAIAIVNFNYKALHLL